MPVKRTGRALRAQPTIVPITTTLQDRLGRLLGPLVHPADKKLSDPQFVTTVMERFLGTLKG